MPLLQVRSATEQERNAVFEIIKKENRVYFDTLKFTPSTAIPVTITAHCKIFAICSDLVDAIVRVDQSGKMEVKFVNW